MNLEKTVRTYFGIWTFVFHILTVWITQVGLGVLDLKRFKGF